MKKKLALKKINKSSKKMIVNSLTCMHCRCSEYEDRQTDFNIVHRM